MADLVFNIAKGAAAEMFRDSAAKGIVMLLKAAEADATLKDPRRDQRDVGRSRHHRGRLHQLRP